jgi:hypothetical protein
MEHLRDVLVTQGTSQRCLSDTGNISEMIPVLYFYTGNISEMIPVLYFYREHLRDDPCPVLLHVLNYMYINDQLKNSISSEFKVIFFYFRI